MAAVVAVPLAVWLIYLAAFNLWIGTRPPAWVRYSLSRPIGTSPSYMIDFESDATGYDSVSTRRQDGSLHGISGSPASPPTSAEDGSAEVLFVPERSWSYPYSGTLSSNSTLSAASPLLEEGRWYPVDHGEERTLARLTFTDGTICDLMVALDDRAGSLERWGRQGD